LNAHKNDNIALQRQIISHKDEINSHKDEITSLKGQELNLTKQIVGASRVMAVRGKSRSPEYLQFYNRFLHFFSMGVLGMRK
jgi:hypothetical protein